MADKIEYGFIPVKEVFTDKWYKIPEYQRPYVWGKEQATDLLEDIMNEAMQQKNIMDYEPSAKREYFLGSLVWKITPKNDGVSSFLEYELLDGQQRLTTMLLITAVIRDLTDNKKRKETCEKSIFQEADPDDGIPERLRIIFGIRGKVQEFVNTYVKADNGTDRTEELSLIMQNDSEDINCSHMAEVILAIRDFFKENTQERIETFFGFFRTQVKVIYVASNELDDAFHLFNVMNNRGIKLRNSDILKAKNLSHITNDTERLSYAEKWENMEEYFGEDFDQFLEFVRLCLVKKKAATTLLKEFEDNIYNPTEYNRTTKEHKKLRPLLHEGKETLDCIIRYYNAYLDIFDNNNNFSILTQNKLKAMDFGIEADFWKAAILHYYIKFKNNHFDEFVDALNRKFTGDWVEEIYFSKRIENTCKLISIIDKAAESEEIFSSDCLSYNKQNLLEHLNSNIYGKRYCRHILMLTNLLLSSDNVLITLPDNVSVEHILPQSPKATSEWVKDFTEEQRELCTNKLGNLMLISRRKNSVLSNNDYTIKKEKYFRRNVESFALSGKIYSTYATWKFSDFEKNHREMINLLKEYFDIQ